MIDRRANPLALRIIAPGSRKMSFAMSRKRLEALKAEATETIAGLPVTSPMLPLPAVPCSFSHTPMAARFVRLSQLNDARAHVTVRCDGCGRRITDTAEEFPRRLPTGLDDFADMRGRLRCERPDGCGRRAVIIVGWVDIWA
jgi:hypothetical protein